MSPSEIALQLYREKQREAAGVKPEINPVLSRYITDPKAVLTFTITKEEAKEYCHSIGLKFFGKKWQDKTVIVSI